MKQILNPWTGEPNLVEDRRAITKNGDATLTAVECMGRIIYVTTGATITLPAVFPDMLVPIQATAAAVVHVDPDDVDRLVLNGTALADGNKISSSGTAGDMITLHADSVDGLTSVGRLGTWIDGG